MHYAKQYTMPNNSLCQLVHCAIYFFTHYEYVLFCRLDCIIYVMHFIENMLTKAQFTIIDAHVPELHVGYAVQIIIKGHKGASSS